MAARFCSVSPSSSQSSFRLRRPSALRPSRLKSCCRCYYTESLEQTIPPIDPTLSLIRDSAVIACLRADSVDLAMEAAQAAIRGGISVLEIVRSTPCVFEVLKCLVGEYPTKTFGVGTVLNCQDAQTAINSGAKFLMSPATIKEIMKHVQGSDVLYIPGVMTPTEILSAYETGAKIVKIYPVSALGGVRYISALKKPFPHIPMVASQGLTIDSVGDYIAQGAAAVVLSDAIFDKLAMSKKNFNTIERLAQSAASQRRKAIKRHTRSKKIREMTDL